MRISRLLRVDSLEKDTETGQVAAIDSERRSTTILTDNLELLGFFLYVLALIGFPIILARAFLRGIAAASDPEHRVTPTSAWDFFHLGLRDAVKLWALFSAGVLCVLLGLIIYFEASEPFSPMQFVNHIRLASSFLSLSLIYSTAAFLWAPRCKRTWTLSALIIATAIPLNVLASLIVGFALFPLLPEGVTGYAFTNTLGNPSVNEYTPLYVLALSAVSFMGVLRWARSRGESWFRFAV